MLLRNALRQFGNEGGSKLHPLINAYFCSLFVNYARNRRIIKCVLFLLLLTLKVLNISKNSLTNGVSGSLTVTVAENPDGRAWGEVVLARTPPILHHPSPPNVYSNHPV